MGEKTAARFISAAKALGLEKSGDAFERAMDTLAPKKPKSGSS